MTRPADRPQGGFTLIEIMVALVLGLMLIGGLGYLYSASTRTYYFNQAVSRMQDNGRFASRALNREIRQAGYMGCASHTGGIQDTLSTEATYRLLGFDDVDGQWPSALPFAPGSQSLVGGADMIAVTRVGNTAIAPDKVKGGRNYMATNCMRAVVYQAASDGDAGPTSTDNTAIFPMRAAMFYVADNNYANVPSLWRKDAGNPAQELVPGVVNMQIMYGEDTDGDHAVDVYRSAAQVADMAHVVSVRIALLLTSLHEVAAHPVPYHFTVFHDDQPHDRYLRREWLVTVNLRNFSS